MQSKSTKSNQPHWMTPVIVVLFVVFSSLCRGNDNTPSVLVFGDSLSAAYGINRDNGWVSLLDQQLNQPNIRYRIINASISGETTGGGLARLPVLLKKYEPDIIILELGANDGLRGFPIATLRSNLKQMISMMQEANAEVLLLGMRIPPNYGSRYTRLFDDSFALLAQQFNIPIVPFFLEGVAGNPQLIQTDGLHPTAAAQPVLLENVMRYLKPLL